MRKLPINKEGEPMATTANKRRSEFVGSGSDKFREISVTGTDVTVRFGRNGTHGQSSVKSFADTRR